MCVCVYTVFFMFIVCVYTYILCFAKDFLACKQQFYIFNTTKNATRPNYLVTENLDSQENPKRHYDSIF